jgi:hypothetical protein
MKLIFWWTTSPVVPVLQGKKITGLASRLDSQDASALFPQTRIKQNTLSVAEEWRVLTFSLI